MKWEVEWECRVYESGNPVAVHFGPKFTIMALTRAGAVWKAERVAPRKLKKLRKEHPDEYPDDYNYVTYILGLRDKKGNYHKLGDLHEVFGGRIRRVPDYGSDW